MQPENDLNNGWLEGEWFVSGLFQEVLNKKAYYLPFSVPEITYSVLDPEAFANEAPVIPRRVASACGPTANFCVRI
jgi:hypothetical protein